MGSIISSGVGSGLDIDGLVKQLVSAEGTAKAARLTAKEAGFQSKLSAFGSFRGALSTLQTALASLKDLSKFQGRSVSVGDEKILTVTSSATAAPGSYDIEVERLASAQKRVSGPYAVDAAVGTGTLQISLAGQSFNITLDSTNNTLAGIRNAINNATNNPGVTASIVNETGVGAHLILSSNKTGAANTIAVTQTPGGTLQPFIDGLVQTQAAADSRVVINGFAHESATNSVTTAVDGLTFNLLKQSDADVTTAVNVTYDKTAATTAVNSFVSAYNTLTNNLKTLSAYNAETGSAGALLGDSTLRDFMFALRREVSVVVPGVSGSFQSLAEIGIVSKVDGTLEVNSTRLDSFINANFDQVGGLFANKASSTAPVDGVARRLDALIETYTKSGGLIEARTAGLQTSIEGIAESREELNKRLGALETRLRAQFNAMDTLVAQLRNTSSFLTQQLATLNGSNISQQR